MTAFLLSICFELFGWFGVCLRAFAYDWSQLLMCASVMHARMSNLAVPHVVSYCCADKLHNTPAINTHLIGPWFTVLGSLSLVHCPWFTVLGSLSLVHCPLFTVLGSLSLVHCPWFTVLGSGTVVIKLEWKLKTLQQQVHQV